MLMIIKGGRIVDPGNRIGLKQNTIYDIIIKNGRIAEIKPSAGKDASTKKMSANRVIDAAGKIVTPGLIDMHVHLREPGHEYKETIASGCKAAAYGGFTAVCSMPNTSPVNDNRQITEYILQQADRAKSVRVYPIAAISKGLKGDQLNEYGDLKEAGAVAVSDDGLPVMNSQLMRRAMEYAKGFGLPVISHCEDLNMGAGGAMNEGMVSTRMGLSGIPNACESVMVMRDIALCELTGATLHIAHVSTKESVNAIREAKGRGVSVTAETAPHYFTLTDEDVAGYNTNAKMNPPLRSSMDRDAVRDGLADGTIDVIATDHAPHSTLEKDVEFDVAKNGIIGLETAVSLSLKLVHDGVITIEDMVNKMALNPARILGIESGLTVGSPAHITIIDPDYEYQVDAERFQSLSRNTPFDGWNLKGKAVLTMAGGKIVYDKI